MNIPYRPQTKLRDGNVFTPVCHSVYRRGAPPGQRLPGKDLFLCPILLLPWGGGGEGEAEAVLPKMEKYVLSPFGHGMGGRGGTESQRERSLNTAKLPSSCVRCTCGILVSGKQDISHL